MSIHSSCQSFSSSYKNDVTWIGSPCWTKAILKECCRMIRAPFRTKACWKNVVILYCVPNFSCCHLSHPIGLRQLTLYHHLLLWCSKNVSVAKLCKEEKLGFKSLDLYLMKHTREFRVSLFVVAALSSRVHIMLAAGYWERRKSFASPLADIYRCLQPDRIWHKAFYFVGVLGKEKVGLCWTMLVKGSLSTMWAR